MYVYLNIMAPIVYPLKSMMAENSVKMNVKKTQISQQLAEITILNHDT